MAAHIRKKKETESQEEWEHRLKKNTENKTMNREAHELRLISIAAFDIMCSSFMLMYLEKDDFNLQPNYIVTEENLLKRGARNQLIMFYQVLVDVKRVMFYVQQKKCAKNSVAASIKVSIIRHFLLLPQRIQQQR